MVVEWVFRPSDHADAHWMAELRAGVMRPDLERLGRYDADRVRRRFLDAFVPAHTRAIQVGGVDVGLVALREEADAWWLEHFYLAPSHQGRRIGGQVLAQIMTERDTTRPMRLNVLQGSPAQRLYERHGFAVESEDPIDVHLVAPPPASSP